jgi:hypothetical protein
MLRRIADPRVGDYTVGAGTHTAFAERSGLEW